MGRTDEGSRPATVEDIHEIARALPGVTLGGARGRLDPTVYQEAILADTSLPFFTTSHFDGHTSVLLRGSRIGEMSRDELAGFVEGAWLSRDGPRAVARWTKERES
jgi:hypothetical protein